MIKLFIKNRHIILYGLSLAALLFLLKWVQLKFIILDHAFEIYAGIIALIFTCLGIWLAVQLLRPKTTGLIVEKKEYENQQTAPNEAEINRLNLSRRELEVLQLMAEGLSNQEIAARLFVSLNTIKTHVSRIFDKMEVKRRTQAVDIAKKSNLIP